MYMYKYCGTLIPQDAKNRSMHNSILCDQSIHICIYFTSSIAWLCIIYRGVSARYRAGQEAREGDAGLTCGGA